MKPTPQFPRGNRLQAAEYSSARTAVATPITDYNFHPVQQAPAHVQSVPISVVPPAAAKDFRSISRDFINGENLWMSLAETVAFVWVLGAIIAYPLGNLAYVMRMTV